MAIRFNNILTTAMRVIGTKKVTYRLYSGKEVDELGIPKISYGDWISAVASCQPGIVSSFGGKCISEKEYRDLGFSWARTYITVWVNNAPVTTSENEDSADQIMYNGQIFNVLQVENWLDQNGWKRCYCVKDRGSNGE